MSALPVPQSTHPSLRCKFSFPVEPSLRVHSYLDESPIHGIGVFAREDLLVGDCYGLGSTHGTAEDADFYDNFGRCPLHRDCFLLCLGCRGRWINDSNFPNVQFLVNDKAEVLCKVLKIIRKDKEVVAKFGPGYTEYSHAS